MSEIKYSQLNEEHRIDAEYFGKDILYKLKQLSNLGTIRIGDIADVTDGIHTSIDYDENSRVNLISATSPKENVFDLSRGAFISEKANKLNPRTALRKNDVIISTVGTIGNCAVVDDSILPANSDRHVGIIRIQNDYSPYVLSTFLLSKYGRTQTLREATGNVQLNLFIYKLKELAIPQFSSSFQFSIEQIVKSAHAKLAESKALYAEAEEILLSELGLKDWQQGNNSHTDSILLTENQDEDTKTKRDSVGISNPCGNIANYSIKRFSDFASSGRLDAEYYQPKYDALFEHLAKYKCTKLGDIVTIRKSVEPGSESYIEKGIPFIRVSDVNKFEIAETDLHLSPKDFNFELLKPHKNTILFSKDGSIGIAYKCEEDLNVITSGALLHLDICNKEVLPDYLTLVLNSVVVHLQAERDSNGAIIQHWKPDDIKKVLIPLLPKSIQALIAEKIQKSFDLRKQSKQLLEQAKRMVEEEIEKQ